MISYSRQQKALEELAELDKISEQKKKEQEEQNAVELFKQKTADIHTTREQSIEEINQWCGNKTFTEKLHDIIEKYSTLILFVFTTMVDSVLTLLVGHVDDIVDMIVVVLLFVLMYLAIFFVTALYLHSFLDSLEYKSPRLIDKIKTKTLDVHYSISENTIDCPIEVKKDLLNRINNEFVYLSVGYGTHYLYYYEEDGSVVEHPSRNYSKEYEYFKDQLTEYKLYKISDIVTDRSVK